MLSNAQDHVSNLPLGYRLTQQMDLALCWEVSSSLGCGGMRAKTTSSCHPPLLSRDQQ